MGTLERIRQLSPAALGVVAVLFIGFMVIQDSDPGSVMSSNRRAAGAVVAEVNGQEISRQDFETMVSRAMEYQRQVQQGASDPSLVRDQVFEQMVRQELVRQTASELGLSVTKAEIQDHIFYNPDQSIQRNFLDSAGNFNLANYQEMVSNPELLLERGASPQQVQSLKDYVKSLEENLYSSLLENKVRAAIISSGAVVSQTELEEQYRRNNSHADVQYVAISAGSISDAEVSVTDEEMKAYYEANKTRYSVEAARQAEYVQLRYQPSDRDRERFSRDITNFSEKLKSATSQQMKNDVFDQETISGSSNSGSTTLEKAPAHIRNQLEQLSPGEISGEFRQGGNTMWVRFDSTRVHDEVKTSHILLEFTEENKAEIEAEAKALLARAKTGEDFAELAKTHSKDPSAAQNNGALPWFSKDDAYVPEYKKASLAADSGDIVGPVETQFGLHIIKIDDTRTSEQVSFSTVSFAPSVSSVTRKTLARTASKIEEAVKGGADLATQAQENNLQVGLSAWVQTDQPTLGSREITAFMFQSNVGDVHTMDMPGNQGIVVVQLKALRNAGPAQYADVEDRVRQDVMMEKKLEAAKAKAQAMYATISAAGSMDAAAAADSSLVVKTSADVQPGGFNAGFGNSTAFSNAAFSQALGTVGEPVKGTRAWYVIQVNSREEADMSQFAASAPQLRQQLENSLSQQVYQSWLTDLRKESNVVDKRFNFNN